MAFIDYELTSISCYDTVLVSLAVFFDKGREGGSVRESHQSFDIGKRRGSGTGWKPVLPRTHLVPRFMEDRVRAQVSAAAGVGSHAQPRRPAVLDRCYSGDGA